ncbi:MAG TPA: hypothetical protein VFJ96_07985 [Gemmatimonadaceae bacterium]|jgi:hypothetical protein|nr:hypothetical protein [Gemmatimonadaceae bacterium]
MRHFHRTQLTPAETLSLADEFFRKLGLMRSVSGERSRTYQGTLGIMKMRVRPEGGHYTFIEVETDQVGESRLDRNVKRYFVTVHRTADPRHRLKAAY